MNSIFCEYDLDHSDKIDSKELSNYLIKSSNNTSLPRTAISQNEINRILAKLDSNGDDQIDKEELKRLIRKSY